MVFCVNVISAMSINTTIHTQRCQYTTDFTHAERAQMPTMSARQEAGSGMTPPSALTAAPAVAPLAAPDPAADAVAVEAGRLVLCFDEVFQSTRTVLRAHFRTRLGRPDVLSTTAGGGRVVSRTRDLWKNQPYARTMPPTPAPDGARRRLAKPIGAAKL